MRLGFAALYATAPHRQLPSIIVLPFRKARSSPRLRPHPRCELPVAHILRGDRKDRAEELPVRGREGDAVALR